MIGDRKIVFNSLTKFGAVFLNGLRYLIKVDKLKNRRI